MLLFLFQSHQFQTWAAKKASGYLSEELNTTVTLEKLSIDFLTRIHLEGILIRDLKKDTLLYGKDLTVAISDYSYSKKFLNIKLIELDEITAKVIKYEKEKNYNYQFVVDYFSSPDTTTQEKSKFQISYGELVLKNLNIIYTDKNDTSKPAGINFSQLDIRDLYGKIKHIKFEDNDVRLTLESFSVKERNGLHIKTLNGEIKVSPKEISLSKLYLETDYSLLSGDFKLEQQSFEDFNDFENKVRIYADLKDNNKLGFKDVSKFSQYLENLNSDIYLSGVLAGTINNLKGQKIKFKTGDMTEFYGDFLVKNTLKPDSMFFNLSVITLSTEAKDLLKLNFPGMSKQDNSSAFTPLLPLGKIKYTGNFKGRIHDLSAVGKLNSEIGSIEHQSRVKNIGKNTKLTYETDLKLTQVNLGVLSNQKDLGTISGNISLNGRGTDLKGLELDFNCNFSSFGYHQYEYKNIQLNGAFTKQKFTGNLELKDKHAQISFHGSAGFEKKNIDFDFTSSISKFEFNKTNLATAKDSIHNLSTTIKVRLTGNNPNNFTGRIQLNDISYQLNESEYTLKDFDLILQQQKEVKNIRLVSDLADVNIDGEFNITDLPNSFRKYMEKYFPTLIKERKIPEHKIFKDHFKFIIAVKNFNAVNKLLIPELSVSRGTLIEGNYDAERSELNMTGKSKKILYKNYKLSDWEFSVKSLAKSIDISTSMQKAWLSDSFYVSGFKFSSSSFDNLSGFNLAWNNNGDKKYSGDIAGKILFSNSNLALSLKKADVWVADSLWLISDTSNFVKVDTSGKIEIDKLGMQNNNQLILLKGVISKNPEEELGIDLNHFQLGQLNPLLKASLTKINGTITGKAKLSTLNNKMIFSSDFNFDNLYVNDKSVGNGRIKSIYDTHHDVVSVDGFFTKGSLLNGKIVNTLEFNGSYSPTKTEDNIDLTARMNALDITLLQPYLTDIITFAPARGGAVEGTCRIKGSIAKPIITGRLSLMNVKNLKVDYLNTFYTATGVINIFPDRILLGDENPPNGSSPEPLHLFDKDGHEATVWGNIFHDNFKISKIDFDINAKNFMVLNTTGKNNPSYFGKAFVTGTVGIYGNADYMNMDINIKTDKNTEFNIPLTGPATVEENNFIVFVNKDTTKKIKNDYHKELWGINLDLNLEATPNANVKLIFDSKSGDVINARGNGNIKMVINTNGKFEMYGLYTLTNGDYLFSLENVISKKFEIISGSTIKWAGDPLNADIDITAGYNQNSSLAPFFPTDSTGMYSKPVKASVLLNMRDKLLTPDISFGISLPTIDETTRQTVLSYVNNEQEMNRQVFSLLLLKSFVTPLQLANQGVGLGAGTTASRTSSEMLSNQLSNWLAQLSTGVDISVNITPEQMDVALSKQLFNDRLSIDGNVGVNNSSGQKTSNMIGDLQVDYKVYPDGKLRLKGFNKSNDNTQISTLGGPFTQGMGIYYKEEFNKVNELYAKYLGWMKKKKKPN